MPEEKTHWVDVRLKVREVAPAGLKPGDRVWYFRKPKRPPLSGPPAYGPFVVVSVEPFRLRNMQNVEFRINPDIMTLLVPTSAPPLLG